MIRPEFYKTLTEQRGAAVILWCLFFLFVPLYLLIARYLLASPSFGRGGSAADVIKIVLWALTVVDLSYYFHWKRSKLSFDAILRDADSTKLFRAVENYQGEMERRAAHAVCTFVTRKIVLFAILGAVAVYGLVLALVGRFIHDQYALSALCLILLTVEFPSERSMKPLLDHIASQATSAS